uniref:Uncharacterized protein n=1 Tax=Cyanistes caeruleus TaxID=156563 RepID=A0A8C0VH42_CYACU
RASRSPGCSPRLPAVAVPTGCAAGRAPPAPSTRNDIRDCSSDPPYLPPTASNTTARLAALRSLMRPHGAHAYIVPSTDAHMVRGEDSGHAGHPLPTDTAGIACLAQVSLLRKGAGDGSRVCRHLKPTQDTVTSQHGHTETLPHLPWGTARCE